MDETEKEINSLKSQIRTMRVLYLTVIMICIFSIISFQIQYVKIYSYYQSTLELHYELNQVLADLTPMIEEVVEEHR